MIIEKILMYYKQIFAKRNVSDRLNLHLVYWLVTICWDI